MAVHRIGGNPGLWWLVLIAILAAHPPSAAATDLSPSVPSPPAAQSPFRWRLAGTLIEPNAHKALFARTNETRVVVEGQQIDNLTLIDVHPGVVTLRADGVTLVLSVEGYSVEEEAEVARRRAEESARANATVRATIAGQAAELQTANDQLLAATHQMQTR